MSRYYLMETDIFCDYGVINSPKIDDDSSFLAGKQINTSLRALVFKVNFPKKSVLPHFLGDVIPLISKELLEMLQKAGITNFQAFPVQLINPKNKQSWNNYFAFNVIGLVQAAKLDSCDYDVLMDGDNDIPPLIAFDEIVLDTKKIPSNTLMFRMTESPDNVVVHEKLLDILIKNKPAGGWGIDFVDVELA